LRQLDRDDDLVPRIQTSLDNDDRLEQQELELLAAGLHAEAGALNDEQVEPSFDAIRHLMGNVKESYGESARRANWIANVGTVFMLVLAAVLMESLFSHFERTRRLADLRSFEIREQWVLRQSEERFHRLAHNAQNIIFRWEVSPRHGF